MPESAYDNEKKQKLLIEYLISSPDTFALCQSLVKPELFDPEFRNTVAFIQKYYDEYNTTPKVEQIESETDMVFTERVVNLDQINYCAKEIEYFCRRRSVEKIIFKSPELLADDNYGALETGLREAILISLNRNLGLSYFENPDVRLKKMLEQDPTEPTGWTEIDQLLFGGIGRGELILFSANSGGGKSITLANLGFNFLMRKKHVLYISLELSEEIIAQRYDTMFSGVSRRDWRSNVSEITTKVEIAREQAGSLVIKQMESGTKAVAVRAYLKEYYLKYNRMPDLLILDYIDNMSPNENVSADNVWQKDKLCSEQLRQIGVDFKMVIATASQLNREAVKATTHDHSHIAGGISKINVSDVYISIKFTEAMRIQNEIMFCLQKTRNSDGVGKIVFLKWESGYLRIIDKTGDTLPSLPTSKKKEVVKGGLLDMPSGDGLASLIRRASK